MDTFSTSKRCSRPNPITELLLLIFLLLNAESSSRSTSAASHKFRNWSWQIVGKLSLSQWITDWNFVVWGVGKDLSGRNTPLADLNRGSWIKLFWLSAFHSSNGINLLIIFTSRINIWVKFGFQVGNNTETSITQVIPLSRWPKECYRLELTNQT